MKLLNRIMMICIVSAAMAIPAMAEEKKTPPGPPPARVVTDTVTEKSVAETTTVVGTLFFDRTTRLSTEVSGLASSVYFREGDRVKKGDLMIRLNTDFIDNEIATVSADISRVRVRLEKAQKDLVRYKTLFKQEAASEQQYDDMTLSRDDLVQQKTILKEKLALARLKKKKSAILAPFDGIILEKNAEIGTWISPGSSMCLMGSLDDLYVKTPVSERFVKFARTGETVHVILNALDKELTGEIAGLVPVADPQTKTILIKIKLPRINQAVVNMSATVRVPIGEKKTMLLVPRDALVNFQGNYMVYGIKDGKAAPMPVAITSYQEDYAAVKANGLSLGMAVVVDGNERLRPGQAVTVIN